MKNRKREICTSGSVRDEAGQPPHLLGGLAQRVAVAARAQQPVRMRRIGVMLGAARTARVTLGGPRTPQGA
jgi:hypothetical protein